MADLASGRGGSGGTPPPPDPGSVFESLHRIVSELPGLVSDRVHLLALEIRRAGLALAQIVALVVASAILVSTAWVVLWCGVVGALMEFGLHWALALLVVLLLNLGAAALAVMRVRRLASLLGLPRTLHHLTLRPDSPPSPPPPAPASPAGASAHDAAPA